VVAPRDEPGARAGAEASGGPVSHRSVMDLLRTIPDPEMPISIVDLGLVEDVRIEGAAGARATVHIDVLPTMIGCPALPMIRDDIESKVSAMDGVAAVAVRFINDPPWSVDRITALGRESLREHGVTVPASCVPAQGGAGGAGGTVTLRTSAIPCPFCGSTSTRLDSPFGPTRCRMIYYCESCRNAFEHMKRV